MLRPIAILIACFLLSLSALANGGKTPISIQGTVTDQNSGNVLPGVVISIERNGQVIHSIETDGQGSFNLSYEAPYVRSDELKVSIFKKGYKVLKMKTLQCEKDELLIQLEKKPKFVPLILPGAGKPVYDI